MDTPDLAGLLRQLSQQTPAGEIATTFTEEPVSLTTFVTDRRYLNNPPLSDVQYDAVRHIERIYYPETYRMLAEAEKSRQGGRLHVGSAGVFREEEPYWAKPTRMTNFINICWGKGSGKDHVARISCLRIAYLLLCLDSPQRYYGMPEQDTIHLLNVASSAPQAIQAFFQPITRAVRRGWFADKAAPRQNVVTFAKSVEAISGHSDAETQEGLNLLLGVADEIDAFRSKKELTGRRISASREPTKSSESILIMLRTSGATRFPEVFKNVRISYPRFLGSTIQQLIAQARKDIEEHGIDSRHYVSGPLATWEVNPRVTGKEVFAADYAEDPVMARARYECKPAKAINPYFRNHMAIDACFVNKQTMPLEVSYRLDARRVWVPVYRFDPELAPVRGAAYAMHADLAVSGDRAGVAMAHVVRYSEHETIAQDEDGAQHTLREVRPVVHVDFVIGYSADSSADPPREIQIRWARQLCFELIRRGFNIKFFSFDSFQSADSMQILRSKGIDSGKLSTDMSEDPWRTLRDLLYEGRISIPRPAPVAGRPTPYLLREELLSLTRLPNGRIDHSSDSSKDMADALACATVGAIRCGGQEEPGGTTSYSPPQFVVGRPLHLPLGMNPDSLWETEMPSGP